MPLDSAPINLTHHFLIAMPGLQDELFSKSVVYVCEHSERGALGLVINKPSDINLKVLFDKVDLPLMRRQLAKLVLPMEQARSMMFQAADALRPHYLGLYLFELAGEYSSFNNADKVLVDAPPVRARRLLLCARTLLILETGLRLLGLRTLTRM